MKLCDEEVTAVTTTPVHDPCFGLFESEPLARVHKALVCHSLSFVP